MTPAVLYPRILTRLDLAEGEYVSSAELDAICREGYYELHDIMLNILGDEAPVQRTTVSTTADDDSVTVAATTNAHRITRIDYLGPDSTWVPVMRGNLGSDVMDANSRQWRDGRDIRYYATRQPRVDAATSSGHPWTLMFDPTPAEVYSVRLWYVRGPAFTISGSLVTVFPDDFPEYVVNHACSYIVARQEGDTRPFEGERERIRARIERYLRPQQVTQHRHINDFRRLSRSRIHPFWNRKI